MKKYLKFLFLGLIVGIILFTFRIFYGFSNNENNQNWATSFFQGEILDGLRKNYASDSYTKKKMEGKSNGIKQVDQKYEKTATISESTNQWQTSEKKIDAEIKSFEAIVQFEQKRGNEGSRERHLMIGIEPEKFDSFVVKLKNISKIISFEVTKVDKSNEFKQLEAKKASLAALRKELLDLRSQNGNIQDKILLANRFQEIETQLQDLGVKLGEFDEENEFCTVRLSIIEKAERTISWFHRIKVAFEWTVQWYLMLVFLLFIFIAGSALCLWIILNFPKLKLFIRQMNNDKNQNN